MEVRKSFVLDVNQNAPLEYIYAKQGDTKSRFLEITLVNSGQAVTIPASATARLQFKRTDGHTVLNDGIVESGKVVVELTEQALAIAGIAVAEIGVYDGETLITSQVFYLKVDESAVLGTTVTSSDEFGALIQALLRVEQADTVAQEAQTAAEAALAALATVEARINTAVNNADSATTRATTAAEQAENIVATINGKTIRKYGARRAVAQSSPTLERVWDSVGLTAQAGTDANAVTNNFDSFYPWSHMRECNISVVKGKIQVNAYKGEPTFALDGSTGDVAVEIPKFYQPPALPGDGYEYWGVCDLPLGGWTLNPEFIASDGTELDKIYIAKYNAALVDVGGVPTLVSRSGLPPEVVRSRTSFRTLARAKDSLCGLTRLSHHDIMSTLFTVEFATLNSQSIMYGAATLSYMATHRPVVEETAVNRVILQNAQAALYVVDQSIDIGTSRGGRQVAKDRRVLSFTDYDEANKAITFDGAPVNTATTQYVYAAGWYSGATDSVVAFSGSPVSNSTGKYPCKYRGIENPWGNVWQWIDGANIQDYQAWVCGNPTDFADDVFAEPYKKLSYVNSDTEGYVKKTGHDERYQWARLPVEVGAGSTTYYSDYYYKNTGNRALFFGGTFTPGAFAGLWSFHAHYAASRTSVSIGARLSWKP